MAYQFDTAPTYEKGGLYLGKATDGRDAGAHLERHACLIAGSGAGKGRAILMPNLLRWPDNVLCIDPKGENVAHTWGAREAVGQTVYALDPFRVADIPDRLRVSCNLLSGIDPSSPTAREDVRAIADGLVMRHNPKNGDWSDAQVDLIAGLIAYVIQTAPPNMQTLLDVRELLRKPNDELEPIFRDMLDLSGCGNLAPAAANIGLTSINDAGNGPENSALSGARSQTKWLDSEGMASILDHSTFDLRELKDGQCSVFLVLPFRYLEEHGRFLRLFVRAALNVSMEREGGTPTLFVLDECYSLGKLDALKVAFGAARAYRLHLLPVFQDMGQLTGLYGPEGFATFFANSDALIFFGVDQDAIAQEYLSKRLGVLTPEEVSMPFTPTDPALAKRKASASLYFHEDMRREIERDYEKAYAHHDALLRSIYDHQMRRVGTPRLTPGEIAQLTGKAAGDKVAASMLVLSRKGSVFNIILSPWFGKADDAAKVAKAVHAPAANDWKAWAAEADAKSEAAMLAFKPHKDVDMTEPRAGSYEATGDPTNIREFIHYAWFELVGYLFGKQNPVDVRRIKRWENNCGYETGALWDSPSRSRGWPTDQNA